MKNFLKEIEIAKNNLKKVVKKTPLELCDRLSKKYQANIYFKREDLQKVRSFKIRGAFNKISQLNDEERKKGVVTASAGNHAKEWLFLVLILKSKEQSLCQKPLPFKK